MCQIINWVYSFVPLLNGVCSQPISGIGVGMKTGPFEQDSFVNKNILLVIEACGTGTFAYVVFIKILPKQFSFLLVIRIVFRSNGKQN